MDTERLYILMRVDLDSMTPGKAMAQAAHAANAFIAEWPGASGVKEWQNQTPQGFGTTIVLAVLSEQELDELVNAAMIYGLPANTVTDPTYPVQDGAVTHHLPVVTCGYVFAEAKDCLPPEFRNLTLHP